MTSSAWTVADEKPIVFRRLALESFRGFNDRQDFDLAANVVVLRGPNGLGKTSVFDALQWLLVGDIARLKESRLRPSDEYIKNEYARTETARVSAELSLAGQQVSVVRTGNRSGSTLAWEPEGGLGLRGRAAEVALGAAFGASEDVSLETALTAAGLLQQDAARLVLKGTPRDRFSLFSQLLGLGSLQRFEAWANKRAKEAADRSEVASQREVETRSRLTDLVRRLDHPAERRTDATCGRRGAGPADSCPRGALRWGSSSRLEPRPGREPRRIGHQPCAGVRCTRAACLLVAGATVRSGAGRDRAGNA